MAWTLEKTSLRGGVYRGILAHGGRAKVAPPNLVAEHDKSPLYLSITPIEGTTNQHQVTVEMPSSLISDGVQMVTICAEGEETPLATFAIVAGDAVPDDLPEEVALLRAELEMLKRAFRRHVAMTEDD